MSDRPTPSSHAFSSEQRAEIEELDQELKYDIQPDQDIQPEEGSPRSVDDQSASDRRTSSTRVQGANDDVTNANEEA